LQAAWNERNFISRALQSNKYGAQLHIQLAAKKEESL